MSKITWDDAGSHIYETGVKNAVLYLLDEDGKYTEAHAWNGISSVSESPSGAEANAVYADDMKYLNLYSTEEFAATVEAYTYPDAFMQCDGQEALAAGIMLGQQARKTFGLCYRTTVGNDEDGNDYGYKLHLIYGCKASPSERAYQTINDSPEAITFSWEISTTPITVSGHKPTSNITIDSKTVGTAKMAKIEEALYGTESTEAYLPTPAEILTLIASVT